MFGGFGEIVKITLKNKFAFVEFAEIQQAAEAIKQLNSRNMNSRMIIEPAKGNARKSMQDAKEQNGEK